MKAHGKWSGFLARFYYATGSIYYAYHWFIALGGLSMLASGTFVYFKAPVLTAIFLVLALFALVLGISFWRKIAKVRLCSLNPGLRIKRLAVDYRLLTETSADYVREVTAKVLFPVDNYQARFNWTGHGKVDGSALKGAKSVEITEHLGSIYNVCRVLR